MKSLEDILKDEIKKLEEEIINYKKNEELNLLFNKLNSNSINLVYLSSSELTFLDQMFQTNIIIETIKKARFLLTYAQNIDVTNYTQYKEVMKDLKNVYEVIQKRVVDLNDIDVKLLRQKKEQYIKLLSATKENEIDNSLSMEYILNTLTELKLDARDENRILISLMIKQLDNTKEDQFDYHKYLNDDEYNIFLEAQNIVGNSAELINSILSDNQYSGYIEMAKQGLINDIVDKEIKSNVELVMLNNYYADIKETIHCLDGLSEEQSEEKKYLEQELLTLLSNIKPLILNRLDNNTPVKINQLIFLDEAKEDFEKDAFNFLGYKNQIVSILSELREGNFLTEKKLDGTKKKLFRKKKANVRVSYSRLPNNFILIIGIHHREELDDNYTQIKNRVNNKLQLIDYLIEATKTDLGQKELIKSNQDINVELDDLIEKKKKSIEGDSYAK